eukprot:403349727
MEESKKCKNAIYSKIYHGDFYQDNYGANGQYLNEIGGFSYCEQGSNHTQYYALEIIKMNDNSDQFAIGKCMMNECASDFIQYMDRISYQSPMETIRDKSKSTYRIPGDDLKTLREIFLPAFYVMWGCFILTAILCILGIIVNFTTFGDLKLKNHNIQVQFTEKEGKEQYIELLSQIDRLLLNRKKIWGIFFLCFSIPRNTMLLFYDRESFKKVMYMRTIKVFGFLWISFSFVMGVAFKAYPKNFQDFPYLTTNWVSVLIVQGQIYGFGSLYFYCGFSNTYDSLLQIYVRRSNFNLIVYILRTFLFIFLSMLYITSVMIAFFPFMGSGPIYALMAEEMFVKNCKTYWWTNLLIINNFYPWKQSDQCGMALTFFANEFWLSIILIPIFLSLYKNTFRKVFIVSFLVITVVFSLIPTVVVAIDENVNPYPNLDSLMGEAIISRIYYRIPAFICGVVLAIIKFEYKYVDKLNDGTYPFHKQFIDKFKEKKYFKLILYTVGILGVTIPVLIQYWNVSCVDQSPLKDTQIAPLTYCWKQTGSVIYIVFSQYFYFIVVWFFASREQDIIISMTYIFQISLSSVILSYLIAIPFYLLCERPLRNFIDLILLPRSSIFKKNKDVDDEDSSDEGDDEDTDEDSRDSKEKENNRELVIVKPQSKGSQLKRVRNGSVSEMGETQSTAQNNTTATINNQNYLSRLDTNINKSILTSTVDGSSFVETHNAPPVINVNSITTIPVSSPSIKKRDNCSILQKQKLIMKSPIRSKCRTCQGDEQALQNCSCSYFQNKTPLRIYSHSPLHIKKSNHQGD